MKRIYLVNRLIKNVYPEHMTTCQIMRLVSTQHCSFHLSKSCWLKVEGASWCGNENRRYCSYLKQLRANTRRHSGLAAVFSCWQWTKQPGPQTAKVNMCVAVSSLAVTMQQIVGQCGLETTAFFSTPNLLRSDAILKFCAHVILGLVTPASRQMQTSAVAKSVASVRTKLPKTYHCRVVDKLPVGA